MTATEFAHRVASVLAQLVPQHDDLPTQVSKKMTEEGADLRMLDVLSVELIVETYSLSVRAHREARNCGDSITTLMVTMNGGLSARSPRLSDRGDQEEARFVDEDDVGAQARRPFFIRGQCRRFHSSILASSR